MLIYQIKKYLLILPILVIGFLFLAPQASAQSFSEWLFPKNGWVDKIKRERILPVGYVPWYYPFSYSANQNGNLPAIPPSGFSVEFTKLLYEEINKELSEKLVAPKISPMEINQQYQHSYPALLNREIAFECNTSLDIPLKPEGVIFSQPFFVSTIHIVTPRDNPIRNIDDVRGKLFISHEGFFQQYLLNELNENQKLDVGILPATIIQESAIRLNQQEARGIIGDALRIFNLFYASEQSVNYTISSLSLGEIAYSCTMLAGEDELKKLIDRNISKVLKSDEYQQLYYRWFILPAKDLNISFSYPMPEGLRELIRKAGGKINPQWVDVKK